MADRWQRLGAEIAAALVAGSVGDAPLRRWVASLGRLESGAFLRVALARWQAVRDAGGIAPTDASVRSVHGRMRRVLYRDPIAVGDLEISGDDLRRLGIPTGPIYAKILNALLERVLEDPARNTPEALLAEVPPLAASLGGHAGAPPR
jgi:tRNA nucleotidyltransferase (CCA-adding enzyme)